MCSVMRENELNIILRELDNGGRRGGTCTCCCSEAEPFKVIGPSSKRNNLVGSKSLRS